VEGKRRVQQQEGKRRQRVTRAKERSVGCKGGPRGQADHERLLFFRIYGVRRHLLLRHQTLRGVCSQAILGDFVRIINAILKV
jgi:hypothetical protein